MERISALMDGELDRDEAAGVLPDLRKRNDLREAWATYHLISDALRGDACVDCGIASAVATRLAKEPTVLAPRPGSSGFGKRWALPSLAAAAAVATVTWMSLETQQGTANGPIAVPASHLLVPAMGIQAQNPLADFAQTAHIPNSSSVVPPIQLPVREFDAYLMAHQEFSPSTAIQGLAPYVRTVTSGPAEVKR
ncbi:MAG: sigma-E factor negative regulatory protein [Burkholderiales bacterium]|nr:sigma-E factor negative regulatory protein [Burkholderiales bacterium]